MFNTTRIPKKQKDEIASYFKTASEGKAPTHVIILHEGHIYKIEMINPNTSE